MNVTTTTAANVMLAPPRRRSFETRPGDHRFFSTMAIVSSIAIVGGFASTYGPKVANGVPVPAIIHVHAAIFAAWLVLFVAQTTLVLTGRTSVHRRLGMVGAVLATLMLVVGIATAISSAHLGHTGVPGVEYPDVAGFLMLNMGATIGFAILVAAGWYFRKSPQTHKRLMLMATAGELVGPGVSRLPFASGRTPVIALLAMTFLLAGPAYDLVTRRRIHPAYLWSGLLCLTTIPPVVAQLSATSVWHSIAAWLLR